MTDLNTSAGARSTPTAALGLAQEVPEGPAHECRGTRLSSENRADLMGRCTRQRKERVMKKMEINKAKKDVADPVTKVECETEARGAASPQEPNRGPTPAFAPEFVQAAETEHWGSNTEEPRSYLERTRLTGTVGRHESPVGGKAIDGWRTRCSGRKLLRLIEKLALDACAEVAKLERIIAMDERLQAKEA